MVKKLKSLSAKKTTTASGGLLDNVLAGSVKESAQQIWLAGMGAFSKAQEEGGRVFDALVKEGTNLQRKTQAVAEEKIGEVTGKMSAMAGSVTAKAGQNWDKLESIFEARTAKALSKLGVPTASDVQALAQRVDALAAAVAKLNPQTKTAKIAEASDAGQKAGLVKPAKARSKSSKVSDAVTVDAVEAVEVAVAEPVADENAKPARKAAPRRAPARKTEMA